MLVYQRVIQTFKLTHGDFTSKNGIFTSIWILTSKKLEKHKRRPGFHQPESGEFSGPSVSGAVSPALSNPLAVKLLDSYVMLHVYLYLQYL